jgi:hypothetical protein
VINGGLIGHILPSELLGHFSIDGTEIKNKQGVEEIEIALTEKNVLPSGYVQAEYESKGFYAPKRIQDFPLRGKAVYLIVKRRR